VGKMIYEALQQASAELYPTGDDTEVETWEKYAGVDKPVYERAQQIMEQDGVVFP
jgi:hypothetical protein